jgi:hypothetical protein
MKKALGMAVALTLNIVLPGISCATAYTIGVYNPGYCHSFMKAARQISIKDYRQKFWTG